MLFKKKEKQMSKTRISDFILMPVDKNAIGQRFVAYYVDGFRSQWLRVEQSQCMAEIKQPLTRQETNQAWEGLFKIG